MAEQPVVKQSLDVYNSIEDGVNYGGEWPDERNLYDIPFFSQIYNSLKENGITGKRTIKDKRCPGGILRWCQLPCALR
jgi:hypothetical protein